MTDKKHRNPGPRIRGLDVAALVLLVVTAIPAVGFTDAPEPEARGDRAFARRAVGADELGRLSEEGEAAAREAVEAYERALLQHPGDIELQFKALEALYFFGTFANLDRTRRVELIDRQLELSDEALARATALGSPELQAKGHFWAAISWGMWGTSHSALAAVRRRVPARVRDHAQQLIDLDVTYADAGGLRLLGRLHAVAPKVPLVSGWIDRSRGIELLERALELSDRDPRNALFLAEALLQHRTSRRAEALGLLRELVAREPDPSHAVEQGDTLRAARALLEEERQR